MADEPTTPKPDDAKPPEGELGDAGRKALEREREARRAAEKRANDAEEKLGKMEREQLRARVAGEKGLSPEQAKHLTGDDEAAMQANADELLAAFKPADNDSGGRRRPVENLRSGTVPGSEPENVDAIADSIVSGA